MGVGYKVFCERCGNQKELMLGGGWLPPEHFREAILEGRFGQDAREILTEHPDWPYHIDRQPFSCSCNYLTDFAVVIFRTADGKGIRCDRHRCSQCGKVLRANSWGKGICWKCGGRMERFESMMWD